MTTPTPLPVALRKLADVLERFALEPAGRDVVIERLTLAATWGYDNNTLTLLIARLMEERKLTNSGVIAILTDMGLVNE